MTPEQKADRESVWARMALEHSEFTHAHDVGDNYHAVRGKVEWDCVKMDIEGAEFEVILAAPHEALRRVKFMYVEFHSWAARTLYEQTMNKLHELFVVKTFKGRDDMEMAEAAFLWRKK
jgi:hypothetical protein